MAVNLLDKLEYIYEESYDSLGSCVRNMVSENVKCILIYDANLPVELPSGVKEQFGGKIGLAAVALQKDSFGNAFVAEEQKAMLIELMNSLLSETEAVLLFQGGSSLLAIMNDITNCCKDSEKERLHRILLPTTLMSMLALPEALLSPEMVYIAANSLSTLPESTFYDGIARLKQIAMIRDASIYEQLLSEMYEVFDKDSKTMLSLVQKGLEALLSLCKKDLTLKKEGEVLSFGTEGTKALQALQKKKGAILYRNGELIALGCILSAAISMHRGVLKSDDFYEIRDMYVPFNLPISFTEWKPGKVVNEFMNSMTATSLIGLRKVGSPVVIENVTRDEIEKAVKEVYFDENAND